MRRGLTRANRRPETYGLTRYHQRGALIGREPSSGAPSQWPAGPQPRGRADWPGAFPAVGGTALPAVESVRSVLAARGRVAARVRGRAGEGAAGRGGRARAQLPSGPPTVPLSRRAPPGESPREAVAGPAPPSGDGKGGRPAGIPIRALLGCGGAGRDSPAARNGWARCSLSPQGGDRSCAVSAAPRAGCTPPFPRPPHGVRFCPAQTMSKSLKKIVEESREKNQPEVDMCDRGISNMLDVPGLCRYRRRRRAWRSRKLPYLSRDETGPPPALDAGGSRPPRLGCYPSPSAAVRRPQPGPGVP